MSSTEKENDYISYQFCIKSYQTSFFSSAAVFLEYHSLNKPSNVVVLRVDPGSFTRPHVDTFKNSLLKNNKDLVFDDIVRLWIPLEDSTFGQVLFVGDQVLSSYKAGEVYTFDNYTLHSAANAGLDIRYTLLVYTTKNNLT